MEDRITPFLLLELSDRDPAGYGAERAPVLLGQPLVHRATWWENCVPHRDDLTRTIPEFRTLGVYEADAPVELAGGDPPPDVRALRFARYPRPGQGTLGSGPTLGLELVLISPRRPEEAQALRDWGDFVHIRDIAAASPDHFTMITPYENVDPVGPRFLHLYELDTDDPEPAFQAMTPTTLARAGSYGAHDRRTWSGHPALVIDYVNTFRRVGALPAEE